MSRTSSDYDNVTGMVGVSYPNITYIERTDRPANVYGIDSIGFFQFDGNQAPIKLRWRDRHTEAVIDVRLNLNLNTMEFVIVEGNSNRQVTKENSYFKTSIVANQSWVPCVMFYDKNQKASIAQMDNQVFEQLHKSLCQ